MNTSTITKPSIIAQLAEIESLSLGDLRARWRELFGTDAPGYSRAHLRRRIGYRLQELRHGGLPVATRAILRAKAEADGASGQGMRLVRRNANDGGPVPGTVFVRTWRDQRHEVTVVEGGFEYQGKIFRSLSAVAKTITGQHWNGKLFFGLRTRGRKDT